MDESGYIQALGKKAAAEAINKARVDVAEQDRSGAVARPRPTREGGQGRRERGRRGDGPQEGRGRPARVRAAAGDRRDGRRGQGVRDKDVGVAQNVAQAEKGKKQAEADRRVYVQGQEAEAVKGENVAKANIADYNAELATKQPRPCRRARWPSATPWPRSRRPVPRRAGAPHAEEVSGARSRAQGGHRRPGPGREDPRGGPRRGRRGAAALRGRGQGHPEGARRQGRGLHRLVESAGDAKARPRC